MSLLQNSNAISAGGYDVNNSVRLRSSASAYLNRTPASAGNRTTWTWSAWVKRGTLGAVQELFSVFDYVASPVTNNQQGIRFTSSDTLEFWDYVNPSYNGQKITTQVFRDPSAWYHIVAVWDTTQATAANRMKLFVNGVQVTSFGTSTDPSINSNGEVNRTFQHTIGTFYNANYGSPINLLDGYLTEINFIDGQALTPSSFGETDTTTGVWKPKAYTGTYGTNGFYLKFSDIATTSGSNAGLGKDFSGNSNYWTTNNISVTSGTTYDAMTDSPTNTSATVANYAVMNPLDGVQYGAIKPVCTNGNLTATGGASTSNGVSTIALGSGKWYCEFTVGTISSVMWFGCQDTNGFTGNGSAYTSAGEIYCNGTLQGTYATFTTNDVIGCAFDITNNQVSFYKNGTQIGTTGTLGVTTKQYIVWTQINASGNLFNANFGQRPFAYTPPTGYVALNTYNLPDSTIKKGNSFMDATTYTGTGASQSISGLNFQPDLVWVKGRSGATDHALYDAVRGVQLQLESNTTTDQTTETTGLTAFNSNGFTVGALAQLNTSSATYVGWSWKETATSGFDIVTYTGNGSNRTISHSLGVAPKMIIVKARTTASTDQGWAVYHSANTAAPETDYLLLNSTAATADLDTVWNDTAPTSSVFSVGTNALVNTNNDTYVAYCWAEIAGFSKFGSYTGNGSTDGPFVYTGFRPKFVMVKNTAIASNWLMYDTQRDLYNVTDKTLIANASDAEGVYADVKLDTLSNGFKIRQTSTNLNGSGNSIIYMAFAESPFKNSLAR